MPIRVKGELNDNGYRYLSARGPGYGSLLGPSFLLPFRSIHRIQYIEVALSWLWIDTIRRRGFILLMIDTPRLLISFLYLRGDTSSYTRSGLDVSIRPLLAG